MNCIKTLVAADVVYDAMTPPYNPSPVYNILALSEYLEANPDKVLNSCIPNFSTVCTSSVAGPNRAPAMLLDRVNVPFKCGSHTLYKTRNVRDEFSLAVALSALVKELAAEYMQQGTLVEFLGLVDFSLQNIGMDPNFKGADPKSSDLRFVDLESFHVSNGLGTYFFYEAIVDGHGFLLTSDVNPRTNSVHTIRRKMQFSMLTMLGVMAVKAYTASLDADMDWHDYVDYMRRTPITPAAMSRILQRFGQIFKFDLRKTAGMILHGSYGPDGLVVVVSDVDAQLARKAATARLTDMLQAAMERSAVELSNNTVTMDGKATNRISYGTFGVVVDGLDEANVMKVFSNVAGGPACLICTGTNNTQKHMLVHHCANCSRSYCNIHLQLAIDSCLLHSASCPYIAPLTCDVVDARSDKRLKTAA